MKHQTFVVLKGSGVHIYFDIKWTQQLKWNIKLIKWGKSYLQFEVLCSPTCSLFMKMYADFIILLQISALQTSTLQGELEKNICGLEYVIYV